MPEYTVTFARSARKELERLSADVVGRIFPMVEALAQNPRPLGCRRLRGFENLWRIRTGDYRVIYQVFDDEMVVDIVAVRHRSQAYRLR
ncbi:MAG: type II toxin-antitoxin system mRNA interferase toxin, RelE/StbE family [Chloroflexota bacterium]|nr:MAG: type II toxin-antitoxin system mRNA interferase toxin, RelE/StbE family [Chloroflexota bacterium]